MDLLDRLLGHDAWTTRQFLDLCKPLSDEQLDQPFDIGHQTVRATLVHMIRNVEAWTDCMTGGPVREAGGDSVTELQRRLDQATSDFAALARPIAERGGWDDRWVDPLDGQERTFGGAIAHVVTHNMHHRAQLRYLLRRLGVKNLPEGDVLSWENAARQ